MIKKGTIITPRGRCRKQVASAPVLLSRGGISPDQKPSSGSGSGKLQAAIG